MTVCICVKVNECMVFAADSATSFDAAGRDDEGNPIMQVYRHGTKVFQLHREFPIMAMTAGLGNFGPHSIAMLAKDFRATIGKDGHSPLGSDYRMSDVASLAHDFFLENRFDAIPEDGRRNASFELWIGGYSSGADRPELFKIGVFDGQAHEPVLVAGEEQVGIWCGGQPDPVSRLINGFGYRLEGILKENGITPESHAKLYSELAPKLHLPLIHPSMPIQDAIDLAEFLGDVTKGVFRFRAVPEYVGGDIDIATVTKYERFRWIKRKHFYSETFNRRTDHAT